VPQEAIVRTSYLHFITLSVALSACTPVVVHRAPPRTARVVVVSDDEDRSRLRVPPGHLPAPGQCRVWFPGRPPGRQPGAGSCRGIDRVAPAGSWILYRPSDDKRIVHARVVDPRRDGVIVVVRVYDADRGTYLGQERRK
jgi:hypothetical protein